MKTKETHLLKGGLIDQITDLRVFIRILNLRPGSGDSVHELQKISRVDGKIWPIREARGTDFSVNFRDLQTGRTVPVTTFESDQPHALWEAIAYS